MKRIIITGANGNLGAATVKKFLGEGYKVIAVSGKSDQLKFAIEHPNFEFSSVNLANEQESERFVRATVAKHSSIDAALLLVGGFAAGSIARTTGTEIQKQFSLNFETAYFVTRPLLEHMQQTGYGRIVYIGGKPALHSELGKDVVAYGLTKSLLFRLAEYINEENKRKNIVASVLVPSVIDTPENRKSMPDANPDNWVKPEQIADVLEFICSNKALPIREGLYKVYNNA